MKRGPKPKPPPPPKRIPNGTEVHIRDDGDGYVVGSERDPEIYDVLREDDNGAAVTDRFRRDELEGDF